MKRWIGIIVVLVAVIGLVGWRMVQKKSAASELSATAKDRTSGTVSVSAAVAGPREMNETLNAVGQIQAPYNVKLAPKISGLIDYLQVREGDTVKAGETLIKLDPDTLSATVLQNQANVAQAKQRFYQAKITQDPTNVQVQTTIRQQKAAVDTAQANLNQVQQNYEASVAASQAAVTDDNAKIKQSQAAQASAEATLLSAQATANDAKTKLNRDLELYKQNYIAAQDVDDQKAAVAVAEAQVNVAEKGIDAAKQAVESAVAERDAAQDQLNITKKVQDANVSVAKAALVSALQALKYAVANTAQTPAYEANLQALKAAWQAADGTLKASQVLLNDINISSPIDGTVTARAMDPGSIAEPTTPILTIQFLKWVYFNASVPVEQSDQIHQGQETTVTLDSLPGKTFKGIISQVDKAADPTSHQFIVLVKLENPDLVLRPGMFGHVSIVTKLVRADITIPREAVTTATDGSTTVMKIGDDNKVTTVSVKLGNEDAHGFEVLSGLSAGDKVVALTYNNLKDGRQVKISALSEPESNGFGVDKLSVGQGGPNGGGATTPNTHGAMSTTPSPPPTAKSSSSGAAMAPTASTTGH